MQAGFFFFFGSSEGTAFGRGTISACVEPEEGHNYHQTMAAVTPLRRHTGHRGSGEHLGHAEFKHARSCSGES